MAVQYTSVILQATYNDQQHKWCADDSETGASTNEVLQIKITIWLLVCLSILATIAMVFISQ